MGGAIDAADAEESKLGDGLATIANLGKANKQIPSTLNFL